MALLSGSICLWYKFDIKIFADDETFAAIFASNKQKLNKKYESVMKRHHFLLGIAMVGLSVAMSSCVNCYRSLSFSEKDMVTETRHLKDFERIEVNGSPTVYYTQADSFSVVVKAPEDVIDEILTEKEGSTLIVRNRGKMGMVNVSFNDGADMSIYVTSPDLTSVRLNGSGDFVSRELIDTDNMEFVLRGSGDIDVQDVVCDRCRVEVVGSGDLDVKNLESRNVSVTLVGSGDIDLNLHRVNDTNIGLRGSGDINVNFNNDCGSVDCQLNGSGDINLSGRVSRFHMEKHGSGDIDIDNLSIEK